MTPASELDSEKDRSLNSPNPTIALLPWGDLIEDFLDSIGVSFEDFCQRMTGGWLFGYIDALRLEGVHTMILCVSARVKAPVRYKHVPTDATICVLPAPRLYLSLRRRMLKPYGWTVKAMFGEVRGIRRWCYAVLKHLAPYLTTPPVQLVRELRRAGCAAILCQEYEYARFDVCVALGKLLRIPVFATFQGGDWQFSRLEGFLRPITMKACAGLIIAPRTERHRVHIKYGVASLKIARIANPLDLANWGGLERDETRLALGIRATARVAVWHGRVDLYRKGLDILLSAWQRVCRQRPNHDLRLLLVGTGDDADELQRRITTMHLHNVLWINEYVLDRVAIRRYLGMADVYLFTSRHEGFPVAPIEAMASGLPVVAADAPGIPDIFEGGEASGGILVPHGNEIALAEALGRVLDDTAWGLRLGANARRRAEICFSLGSVGEQLYTFFFPPGVIFGTMK